jgi:hypothetical protein
MRYCSVFGIPRVFELSSFDKRLFVFISVRTIDPALDKSAMAEDLTAVRTKIMTKEIGN